jgi:calmodulin
MTRARSTSTIASGTFRFPQGAASQDAFSDGSEGDRRQDEADDFEEEEEEEDSESEAREPVVVEAGKDDIVEGLDEFGLPNLELKWRRVQHTCLDGGYFGEFEIQSLRVAFRRFQVPQSRDIHKDDLIELINYLGYIMLDPKDVQQLADEISPYSNLDFDELVRFVEKYACKETARMHEVFEKYDADESRNISASELRSMMADLGFNPSKQLIHEATAQVDVNNDGELSFREFVHFFTVYRHGQGFTREELRELRVTYDSFCTGTSGFMETSSTARALIQAFGLQFEKNALACTKVIARRKTMSPRKTETLDVVEFHEFLAFARQLRAAEQQEYAVEFHNHDVDGSGFIELEELQVALRNLGHEPTRGVIVEVLKEVEFELDGNLDMQEFYNFMLVFRDREGFQKKELEELMQVFHKFDDDNSLSICVHELGAMLRYMGHNVTMADLHLYISQVDVDRSGDLDFREFIRLMRMHRRSEVQRLRKLFEAQQDRKRGKMPITSLPGALDAALNHRLPQVTNEALPMLLARCAENRKTLGQLAHREAQFKPTRRISVCAAGIADLGDKSSSYLGKLSSLRMASSKEVPLQGMEEVSIRGLVQVLSDTGVVKQACANAGLSEKDNVARSAVCGTVVHVLSKDEKSNIVKCQSPLQGEIWFAIDALCATTLGIEIADKFATSLPALQSCEEGGIDFDAYVELADLFRTMRNSFDRMKAGFTDAEIKQFQSVFALYDLDDSGDIDERELQNLLKHIGLQCRTKDQQATIFAALEKARQLATEAGVDLSHRSNANAKRTSFWEFVQLIRMERSKMDRVLEERVEQASKALHYKSEEVAQFREIFIEWARWDRQNNDSKPKVKPDTKEKKPAKGEAQVVIMAEEEGMTLYALIKLLQSLGCSVRVKDEQVLAAQMESKDMISTGQLSFVGFLQMMRWLLDSDFCSVNKVLVELLKGNSKMESIRPW